MTWHIGKLSFSNNLIQGPLAGFSAAPFRRLFYHFTAPAYAVTEMISAHDVLTKHELNSRYIYRAPEETKLCYQLSGTDPHTMAAAAQRLEMLGADLIDINCGCPKIKIRKKGAGSALMEHPEHLKLIVETVRQAITIPLTVKLRLSDHEHTIQLARMLETAGADALIIHGRRWTDDYDIPCDLEKIRSIKHQVNIPIIANGDICDTPSLNHAFQTSEADACMIARAGCGRPWLYQELLTHQTFKPCKEDRLALFMQHLDGLSQLETPFQAVMQSKTLVKYYFRDRLSLHQLQAFYTLTEMNAIKAYLEKTLID